MGLNACIEIKTKKPLTEQEVNDINYDLASRFEVTSHPALRLLENGKYSLDTYVRYYGSECYERSNGLQIFGVLYYLLKNDLIETVYYGSDAEDELLPWNEKDVFELLDHYIKVGNEPYWRRDNDEKAPICCGRRMFFYGYDGKKDLFKCFACDKNNEEKEQ